MTESTPKCTSCGGVAHPVTGDVRPDGTIVCGPCTRSFLRWLKGQLNRSFRIGAKGSKKGHVRFYDFIYPRKESDDE